ncbi:cytochrome P450 [Geodermatophilus sp. TF02-6]|uniref:cytochrome P450 n=1 Tax=Geodermatophilus sp. TF02-6 TaxID=2250575 RepID=UPI001F3DF260|nr:cytochrome P450 [Geodermatophilus sp. TF02-6]
MTSAVDRRQAGQVVDVELFDPQLWAARGQPTEAFAALRAEAPVAWIDEVAVLGWPQGPGYWGVFRHADVRTVNTHPDVFSSQLGATQIHDPAPDDLVFQRRMLLNLDPPEHSVLRRTVNRAFTPRAVARMSGWVHDRAREIVGALAGTAACDFAQDVGRDLPLLTLAEIMGVPREDRHLLLGWANRVIGVHDEDYATTGDGGRPVDPRSRASLQDMFDYAHQLAAHKRAHPGDDLISMLLAGVEGQPLTDEEFENFFFLLSVAGNETLRNAIPGGMLALLEHPDQLARLRADRSLLPNAVDEMLRWVTPVTQFRRTATRDTELAGQRIAAGDKVVVYYASANRDEAVFDRPDVFDVARTPNDHLSFGVGPHFCLGTGLARLQMTALFGELLDRLHDVELAGDVVRLRSNFQNGIKRLPITYRYR